jgi:hypothetical protein
MTEPDSRETDLLAALPGLVRIAAGAWWRTAGWAAGGLRATLRRLLDVSEPEAPAPPAPADPGPEPAPAPAAAPAPDRAPPTLRDRGAELLRRSADVDFDDDAHPAYERILDELAPDEGRILRLLAVEGAQPAIDVRTAGALGVGLGSELVAPGLNMVGREAGCRHGDRVPAYLDNLHRLGLVWFSREPLENPLRYQVLEAQPEVGEALQRARRGRTVRRSILLTSFGAGFCEACLPLHTAELDRLPGGAGQRATPGEPAS